MRIAIVAGEESGDQLGFKLMRAIRRHSGSPVEFVGVGGDRMTAEGLASFFPLADIAVMGILPVIRRLPTLLRRIRETASRILLADPAVLIIIDSPDFTHRVAKRVRRGRPELPIVDYVSPSVWAWRPGRARAMRRYVDHLLALLPFEPDVHVRLGGPPCTYVGHPLIERLSELRPDAAERHRRATKPPILVVLPGSRRGEIVRLMDDFGAALGLLAEQAGPFDLLLPAVDHLAEQIEDLAKRWPVKPRILRGEAAKLKAFREAHVALAASGTVTLELALAGVPMVVAYKVAPVESLLRYAISVTSIVLPNLILGRRAIPEIVQEGCTPAPLAEALVAIFREGAARRAQQDAFATLDGLMRPQSAPLPSDHAAEIVLRLARSGRGAGAVR